MNHNIASYKFPKNKKVLVRERANGRCEFPGKECRLPNNNEVHHITGRYEAKLSEMSPESISDIKLNAVMLCEKHKWHHDRQEAEHILHIMESITPEHSLFRRK